MKKSRRQILQAGSALIIGATHASSSLANVEPKIGDAAVAPNATDYWQTVRAQFSFNETAVPMNAANLCPSFRAVSERVAEHTADIDHDPSSNNRAKFRELLENSRSLVANQLNVSPNEIALVRNTSEANNIICNGLPLASNDEVILWDLNHPSNNTSWKIRSERIGFKIRKVSTPKSLSSVDELVNVFTSQFSSRTKVLSLTHVSNVNGVKLPVAAIAEAAHKLNIHVHSDGAQVWGAMDLDLAALGVDSFSGSAHKWYMGPKEVGLLYVKEEHIGHIWPSIVSLPWGAVEAPPEGARKFESLGQRDDAALAALAIAAEMHNKIGSEKIEARIAYLAQRLKSELSKAGLPLYSPMSPLLSFGVCIVQASSRSEKGDSYIASEGRTAEIVQRLYSEYGIACAAVNGIRLCPTIYNTDEHIDRAVEGLKSLIS